MEKSHFSSVQDVEAESCKAKKNAHPQLKQYAA